MAAIIAESTTQENGRAHDGTDATLFGGFSHSAQYFAQLIPAMFGNWLAPSIHE